MKYYTLARKMSDNPTLVSIKNNQWVALGQGHVLAENFESPVLCELDEEFVRGEMASLYQARGVICLQAFVDELVALGVDNIEVKPAIIRSEDGTKEFDQYVLLNILGRVAGADLGASEVQSLGEGMNLIDSLVFAKDALEGRKLFLVDEDTNCIVVNEHLYTALNAKFDDLFFEEVSLV